MLNLFQCCHDFLLGDWCYTMDVKVRWEKCGKMRRKMSHICDTCSLAPSPETAPINTTLQETQPPQPPQTQPPQTPEPLPRQKSSARHSAHHVMSLLAATLVVMF